MSSSVVSNVPLPHNAHHCLNTKSIFRKKQEGRSKIVSRDLNVCVRACMCTNGSLFLCICFYICMLKPLLLCVSLVYVSNPSLIQSSYCSVTAGRRAVRKGRDFWLESISLTPETSGSFFCQKAKNIRKRTFLCVADVEEEVGSVLAHGGDTGTGRGKGREGCLFPLTVCRDTHLHVSVSVCVCLHEVSGSCLHLVSLLWKFRQVPAGGGCVAQRVTCTVISDEK